jgi:phosphoglycolate phosphatase
MNAALSAFGLPIWTREEVKARARLALAEAFPKLFGAEWERARDIFYAEVRATHLQHVAPLPGIEAALAAAAALPQGIAQGIPQGVVSNKQGAILRAEAAHLGWERYFGALVGAGDTPKGKPDPMPVLLALSRLGVDPGKEVWFLGDTAVDMQAARAAGCSAVLIGDAEHDGGVANAAPDAAFADGHALLAQLGHLAKPGGGGPR